MCGKELSNKATTDELITCIQKDVWERLDPTYVTQNAIPSRMFLTPKTLPNGKLDRVKGRIVAGDTDKTNHYMRIKRYLKIRELFLVHSVFYRFEKI
jgi:hypothetical protein